MLTIILRVKYRAMGITFKEDTYKLGFPVGAIPVLIGADKKALAATRNERVLYERWGAKLSVMYEPPKGIPGTSTGGVGP